MVDRAKIPREPADIQVMADAAPTRRSRLRRRLIPPRREMPCPQCGYDLRATIRARNSVYDLRCPECGEPTHDAAVISGAIRAAARRRWRIAVLAVGGVLAVCIILAKLAGFQAQDVMVPAFFVVVAGIVIVFRKPLYSVSILDRLVKLNEQLDDAPPSRTARLKTGSGNRFTTLGRKRTERS